ncbi:MAG TPA: glycosyltransferase family 39 protein, partial [Candidatus Eisenbacteria bacterium]|nr:glycosyltransferase family 39 protein [Candidatus Eisenbacteria bacterium]
MIAIPNYGYFRDELYYIACSKHLAWGFVDHPPLSIALLAMVRATLGESLWAIRALPALSGAGTVFLTGLLVRELGGGRFAQALACFSALIPPVWLAVDHFFSMNAFDTFFWTLAAWMLLRAISTHSPRTWIGLGLVVGLGLLNKWSMAWFVGGAVAGILLTHHRRVLLTPRPWAAAMIAAILVAPNLIWEARHDWATLEFMRNATQEKMVRTGVVDFWGGQLLVMNPVNVLIWIPGLVALLRSGRERVLGLLFLAVAAFLMASGSSRPNYLAVAYAPLLAAGATAIERASARRRSWLRPAALGAVALLGLPIVPMGIPVLPVDQYIAYSRAIGVRPKPQEHSAESDLPQVFADMFGWEEMVQRVARVYHALPREDQARCSIFAENYGEAGAIDFFGPRYGLPPAISRHNNYWLWGPRGGSGEVMILVGGDRDD